MNNEPKNEQETHIQTWAKNIEEWNSLCDLVDTYFNDRTKTHQWFNTENPLLGGISPCEMIRLGRGEKLKKFIETQLEGNSF